MYKRQLEALLLVADNQIHAPHTTVTGRVGGGWGRKKYSLVLPCDDAFERHSRTKNETPGLLRVSVGAREMGKDRPRQASLKALTLLA